MNVDETQEDFAKHEVIDVKKASRKSSTSNLQTPLETYLREINETALLTADEEKELARAIAKGDVRARDRMVRANLRLCLLYTSPSPRDQRGSRMPSSA